MKILALDIFENKLTELVDCLRSIFPEDEIISFGDPFFAAQYGFFNKVDIVITEICINSFNGIEVANMIRLNNRKSLVVFLADTDKFMNEAKEVSHSAYLVRPVTVDAIRKVIARNSVSV